MPRSVRWAISVVLSFTNIAGDTAGSPGDASLWRTTGIALIAVALIVALAGILSSLFEQAERRAERERERKRRADSPTDSGSKSPNS